jgi:hypothetical protein
LGPAETRRAAVGRSRAAEFLVAYQRAAARFELGPGGWSFLAGIGKVESDHGRSSAWGV